MLCGVFFLLFFCSFVHFQKSVQKSFRWLQPGPLSAVLGEEQPTLTAWSQRHESTKVPHCTLPKDKPEVNKTLSCTLNTAQSTLQRLAFYRLCTLHKVSGNLLANETKKNYSWGSKTQIKKFYPPYNSSADPSWPTISWKQTFLIYIYSYTYSICFQLPIPTKLLCTNPTLLVFCIIASAYPYK